MANVLVIEDDRDLADVLCSLVEALGHRAARALDAETALDLLETGKFSPTLILCDLTLPGMHGLTFLRSIRENARFPAFRFVAMSGSGADRAPSLSGGATDYLLKPFTMNELERILKLSLVHDGVTPE